jgi:hypothetical protein
MTCDRASWVSAIYETYDKAIVGAASEEVLQNIARLICGKGDDGCGNPRRESAKQLVVSVLLARECGSDPMDVSRSAVLM